MDTLRGYEAAGTENDYDYGASDPAVEAPPAIGTDERRMHVRAYNYWASLLGDRTLPSIEDLTPEDIEDFGPHSVLLDFTAGVDDPAVIYLGTALRAECEITGHIDTINDVPTRSLLSRLTDHYLQIIANAAPIGFEAEFVNQRGAEIMYRGILMPFSSDCDTIDFVYGVINWKEMASRDLTDALVHEVDQALRSAPATVSAAPIWADGPSRAQGRVKGESGLSDFRAGAGQAETGRVETDLPESDTGAMVTPDADAGLADWLAIARDCAHEAAGSDVRSRSALYRAIGLAYDFALAAQDAPDDYAEMLDDAGIKVQARSPMTAVVKLVFGADYDKTRITEYATALDHGWAQGMAAGSLAALLENYAGGLKGLVQDERAARRAERPARPDPAIAARAKLKAATDIAPENIATDADGLAVLVARRESDGTLVIVATLPADAKLAQQVVTAAAH